MLLLTGRLVLLKLNSRLSLCSSLAGSQLIKKLVDFRIVKIPKRAETPLYRFAARPSAFSKQCINHILSDIFWHCVAQLVEFKG